MLEPNGSMAVAPNRSPRTISSHLWMSFISAFVIYDFRERGWVCALLYIGSVVFRQYLSPSFERPILRDGVIAKPGYVYVIDELKYLSDVFRTRYAWRIERDCGTGSPLPEPSESDRQDSRSSLPTHLTAQISGDHACDEPGIAGVSHEEPLRLE
jgi:hypothetical protein